MLKAECCFLYISLFFDSPPRPVPRRRARLPVPRTVQWQAVQRHLFVDSELAAAAAMALLLLNIKSSWCTLTMLSQCVRRRIWPKDISSVATEKNVCDAIFLCYTDVLRKRQMRVTALFRGHTESYFDIPVAPGVAQCAHARYTAVCRVTPTQKMCTG